MMIQKKTICIKTQDATLKDIEHHFGRNFLHKDITDFLSQADFEAQKLRLCSD